MRAAIVTALCLTAGIVGLLAQSSNRTLDMSGTPAAGPRGGGGAAAHSPAYLIKVSAQQDGTFTVTNTRNNFSKTYKPKP